MGNLTTEQVEELARWKSIMEDHSRGSGSHLYEARLLAETLPPEASRGMLALIQDCVDRSAEWWAIGNGSPEPERDAFAMRQQEASIRLQSMVREYHPDRDFLYRPTPRPSAAS